MANAKPLATVISGDGINCELESRWGLELAGFDANIIHVTDLLDNPDKLKTSQMLIFPGGFCYGDEIASGKVLAVKLRHKLKDALHNFIDQGNLVMGICNGFQVLVQLALLPDSNRDAQRVVSLAHNSGGRFINKWVEMEVPSGCQSLFFKHLHKISLPMRHGEGRISLGSNPDAKTVELVKSRAVLRYLQDVNGSFERIAGLTNEKGNVLGLMPHPEAFVRWTQHPAWTDGVDGSWVSEPRQAASLKEAGGSSSHSPDQAASLRQVQSRSNHLDLAPPARARQVAVISREDAEQDLTEQRIPDGLRILINAYESLT